MGCSKNNNKIGKIVRAAEKEFVKIMELLEPRGPQSHVTLAARGTIYENLNYSIRSADKFRGKANVSRIEYLCDFFRAHTREF